MLMLLLLLPLNHVVPAETFLSTDTSSGSPTLDAPLTSIPSYGSSSSSTGRWCSMCRCYTVISTSSHSGWLVLFASANVALLCVDGQTGVGQSLWAEEMADWGGGLQDWTALLPLLVSPLHLQVLVQTRSGFKPSHGPWTHFLQMVLGCTLIEQGQVEVLKKLTTTEEKTRSLVRALFFSDCSRSSASEVRVLVTRQWLFFFSWLVSLRTSETSYLNEAFSFYSAIRQRSYYYQVNKEDR